MTQSPREPRMTESPRRHAELILERDSVWGDEDAEIVARAYLELLEQTAAPGGGATPAENSAPSARTDGARTPEAGAAA